MKSFGAIIFLLATAGSFVTGTPAFSHEKRALLSHPVDIAARAMELVPRIRVVNRNANETENAARSLGARAANSTEARSLVVRQSANSSDAEAEKRSNVPMLRRANWGARAQNETDA
ncbi:hypothetical protein F4819DRAFT_65501 [Hypoxylon fuscum]|nr:hypothetical protein F4819DRAFT_65501 [Hypoxylon fuscum]